jgi:archaellum component FlaF (FlaF/FlaG flagellin family)
MIVGVMISFGMLYIAYRQYKMESNLAKEKKDALDLQTQLHTAQLKDLQKTFKPNV